MKPQFITDARGKRIAAVIPITDYEKLIDRVDELAAIKAYDKAKKTKQTYTPAEDMFKRIESRRGRR